MSRNPNALPGIGSDRTAAYRNILTSDVGLMHKPAGVIVDGSLSRDPGNTSDIDVLRAGLLLGKITTGGKYAPAIIGTLGDAYDGAATQMNVLNTPEATEISRRLGTSGTFKLTGPPSAAGTVRTETVTYSAVGTGSGGDEVQTLTPDAASSAGTYTILLQKPDGTTVRTADIAWDATLVECQAAITLALGATAGWVASSSGSAAPFSAGPIALVLTASHADYDETDYPMCTVDISSLTGVTTMTGVQTTRGIPVAGTITVTAVGASANEVHTFTFGAAMTAGVLAITYFAPDGFPIVVAVAWSSNIGTTIADWNTASTVAATAWAGTTSVGAVMTGDATKPVLTFSGVGFAALAPTEMSIADLDGTTGPVSASVAQTVDAVTAAENDFAAGSFIQPVDGSETIIGIQGVEDGFKVTDQDGDSIDVALPRMIIGAQLDSSQIINWPTDTSLIAHVKSALEDKGIGYTFDDAM